MLAVISRLLMPANLIGTTISIIVVVFRMARTRFFWDITQVKLEIWSPWQLKQHNRERETKIVYANFFIKYFHYVIILNAFLFFHHTLFFFSVFLLVNGSRSDYGVKTASFQHKTPPRVFHSRIELFSN